MLFIYCPYCEEKRDEQEFGYAGEAYIPRPENPDTVTDEVWGDYVFMRKNRKGWIWEQWSHNAGCRKVFVAKRNNVSNQIDGTYTLENGKALYLADEAALGEKA